MFDEIARSLSVVVYGESVERFPALDFEYESPIPPAEVWLVFCRRRPSHSTANGRARRARFLVQGIEHQSFNAPCIQLGANSLDSLEGDTKSLAMIFQNLMY